MDTQKISELFKSPVSSIHYLRRLQTEPSRLTDRLNQAIVGLNQMAADEGLTTAFTDGGDVITDFQDEDLASDYNQIRAQMAYVDTERDRVGRKARNAALGGLVVGVGGWFFATRTNTGRRLARRLRRKATKTAKRFNFGDDNQAAAFLQELALGGNSITIVPLTDEATAWHGSIAVDKTGFTLYSEGGDTIRFRAEAVLNVNVTVDDDGPAEALVTISAWKTVDANTADNEDE